MSFTGGLQQSVRHVRRRMAAYAALAIVGCAATALTAPEHPARAAPHAPAPAAQTSTACTAPRSTGTSTMHVGSRSLKLYVPRGAPSTTRLPTVLLLHGTGSTGGHLLRASKLARTADRYGFMIAAPNGGVRYGDGYAWNVPNVPLLGGEYPPRGAPSDTRYLGTVIDRLQSTRCADPHRTYAAGFSGGARMASSLACSAADELAAVAPVGGLRAGATGPRGELEPTCTPSRPVGVFAVHGTADHTNPMRGGGQRYWGYSDAAALHRWARLDHCALRLPDVPRSRASTLSQYVGCDGDRLVQLLRIRGVGHRWPLPTATSKPGVDVNQMLWTALARYRG